MQYGFLALFGLFWSGMVLIFDGFITHGIYKQAMSQYYPSVDGQVIHSEVGSHRGSKGGTSYSADITYQFVVNGQTFTKDRLRYDPISSSSYAAAFETVAAHPVNSTIRVFYNPADPQDAVLFTGIAGADFMLVLFLTPFNIVMLAFWTGGYGWLREHVFRPVAGGVKIITEGPRTRVRLPQFAAIWWGLGTTGVLSFISIFIVGFSTQMQPPLAMAIGVIVMIFLAGLGAYLWQWQKINSGIDDLVIDLSSHTLALPQVLDRKEPVTVNMADVAIVTIEKITHYGNKGGVSYTYAPTLCLRGPAAHTEKLADWSDQLKAKDFAEWLSGQLKVPFRLPEIQ